MKQQGRFDPLLAALMVSGMTAAQLADAVSVESNPCERIDAKLHDAVKAFRKLRGHTQGEHRMRSEHGHPLVLSVPQPLLIQPTITVELSNKWYKLYLVDRNPSRNTDLDFGLLEEVCEVAESAFCDHCPNPNVVVRFADKYGYAVDPLALELMIGRWELEYITQNRRYRAPGEVL